VFFSGAPIFKLVISHNLTGFFLVSNQDLKVLGLGHEMAMKAKNNKFWNSHVLLLYHVN
jgi:hypothetical protein